MAAPYELPNTTCHTTHAAQQPLFILGLSSPSRHLSGVPKIAQQAYNSIAHTTTRQYTQRACQYHAYVNSYNTATHRHRPLILCLPLDEPHVLDACHHARLLEAAVRLG